MLKRLQQASVLVFQNLSTFLVALGLAVAVWVAAVNQEDPFEERAYPSLIPIELQGLPDDLIIVNDPLEEAAITLRAPSSVFDTLVNRQLQITADLSALEPGEFRLPLVASVDHPDARVLDTDPPALDIVVERLITREFPITLRVVGEPALGYQILSSRVAEEIAMVTGPESLVSTVSDITGTININGLRESTTQQISLRAVNADGRNVTGIDLAPAEVRSNVIIRQQGGYRDVAVRANIEGQVAAGYRVTNIVIAPQVVTVFSEDPQQVENLPGFIETEPLDITDASDDVDARLTLALPEGVSLVGDQSVQVQVSIAALLSSLVVEPPIQTNGLAPNLNVELTPETVVVILSGPLPVLETLDDGGVVIVLDLLGLRAGVYELEPEVVVSAPDVVIENVVPPIVQVTISPSSESTIR